MRRVPAADEPSDASQEPASAAPSEADVRFNFRLLLIHGMLGQTGFRLLGAPTFLPTYLSLLAGNNSVVGIARAVHSLGMSLSPYIGAWMVEHRTRVKRLGILFGGAMRLQVLFLALAALLLSRQQALVVVWVVLGLWGLTNGLQMVTFSFIISKAIPAHRRGRLLGLRNATAGLTLLGVSAAGGWLLDRYGFPLGFGWTFLMAFVLTALGLVAFLFMREPDTYDRRLRSGLLSRLADVPGLLRSDPDFSRFVVARVFAIAARGALPFYILYIGQQFELSGTRLAVLTILYTIAESQGALMWGLLSDRTGFRIVFLCSLGTWALGNAAILYGNSLGSSYAVFVLVGAGFAGFMLASQNLVLEFGDQADRPMRIAATNGISEFAGVLSFLAAGLLSDTAPLSWIFSASIVLLVVAAGVMWTVRDPRAGTSFA